MIEPDNDRLCRAVAVLLVDGVAQKEIAIRLGISPASVSRLAASATQYGYLDPWPKCLLSDDEITEVRRGFEPEGTRETLESLAKLHHRPPPLVYILESRRSIETEDDWDEAVLSFGRNCAPHVQAQILKCAAVGVTWGRTLLGLVNGICSLPNKKKSSIKFFPLWGEDLGLGVSDSRVNSRVFPDRTKLSPSSLAYELNEAINQPDVRSLSLRAVPGFIPRSIPPEKMHDALGFLAEISAYRQIFGTVEDSRARRENSLSNRADCIVTTFGGSGPEGRFWNDDFIEYGKLEEFDCGKDRLLEATIGDVGGILLAKEDSDSKGIVANVLKHFTGLKEEDLKACASRVATDATPGVIALGVGKERALSVCEAVKRGLVNQVFIDPSCAKGILKAQK